MASTSNAIGNATERFPPREPLAQQRQRPREHERGEPGGAEARGVQVHILRGQRRQPEAIHQEPERGHEHGHQRQRRRGQPAHRAARAADGPDRPGAGGLAVQVAIQVVGEVGRAGVAVALLLLQRPQAHRFQVRLHAGLQLARAGRRAHEDVDEDAALVLAAERDAVGEQPVEHRAQAVHVGARVGRAAGRVHLLGAHVVRRAQDRAGAREPQLVLHACQAEVGELRHAFRGEQHVARLDVAVHHAVLVRVVQPARQVAAQPRRALALGGVGRAAFPALVLDELLEAPAGDHLLHDQVVAARLGHAVHAHDVAVRQPRGGFGLALEAGDLLVGERQVLRQDLHRHRAPQRLLARFEHLALTARSEVPDEQEIS